MIARSKKIFGYFFCLMITVLYAKATCAYVLQGPHIIELMTVITLAGNIFVLLIGMTEDTTHLFVLARQWILGLFIVIE